MWEDPYPEQEPLRVVVMGSGVVVVMTPTAVQVVWLIVMLAGLVMVVVARRWIRIPPPTTARDLV